MATQQQLDNLEFLETWHTVKKPFKHKCNLLYIVCVVDLGEGDFKK